MAGKSKFTIFKLLEDRVTKLTTCVEEYDHEFANIDRAFILGFHCGNVTNYIGLTTDFQAHNASGPVVGIAYFKDSPDTDQITSDLRPIREYFYLSSDGSGSHATDKNEHLFLIYSKDVDGGVVKRIFDANANDFLGARPSLSVQPDIAKIYKGSAICKLNMCLKLGILDSANKLQSQDKLDDELNRVDAIFKTGKDISLKLISSDFSTKAPLNNACKLETLYSTLVIPDDVERNWDYLPQGEKKEKQDKWRNRIKDERGPFEFQIHHEGLSVTEDEGDLPNGYYKIDLSQNFIHLQVDDSISKCFKLILFALRLKLGELRRSLSPRVGHVIESDEFKLCTFQPKSLGHFISAIYMIPSTSRPDYEQLRGKRESLHRAYMIPFDKPNVRYSQRVTNCELRIPDQQSGYLCNVHLKIPDKPGSTVLEGAYTYHHYGQDRIHDSGWGCAYRSLQTIISWFKHQAYIYSPDIEPRAPDLRVEDKSAPLRDLLHKEARVPTHQEIQSVLVHVGDKQANFVGSEKWIGSLEVSYVLDHLYNLESKFVSVSRGSELDDKASTLIDHFETQSTPIMIGGGVLAHTILGIQKKGGVSYLILDPHYTGGDREEDVANILKKEWCGWRKKEKVFDMNCFYNLCLPQRPREI